MPDNVGIVNLNGVKNMRWTTKFQRWKRKEYRAKKNNFVFVIVECKAAFYVVCSHTKKDITHNSLWETEGMATLEEAKNYCFTFQSTQHQCLGDDV